MSESILVAKGAGFEPMDREEWEKALVAEPEVGRQRLAFMTPEHHAVRNFVVREMPRFAAPLPPAEIASSLGLSRERVDSILGDLESRLFFLVRNERGEVSWAFPVTAEPTPHRLIFSTGERLFGA